MKSLFGALLILSFCCFVLGCFECMPEVIGPIDVDDDNGGHVVVVNLPNGKRWTSAVEKIPKEIADYSFSAVVDVLVEFNCETVVKDASGKRIGRSPATEGIGFFVNYSQGRYMSKFVMSSSHALKPWHLPNFKDRYPDLNEANCKVHKASFETNGNNVDFEEYHFVENSTPGFGNGDDIVVFVPPLEHVMEVPGFNVEKSWENEEACYLVTLSKRENDFETQKPAFVVDVLENTEDLEAEYETIEREYNETFVGKGFVIVAEGTCKYGSNGWYLVIIS
eukprot:TRINITY_DN4436_c0_g1_i1.p1 TRINITY_DN4436_c0_g1~~TRINITY_DN4436_c0_g1_i1.p1  ORF type:complete len:279 (+),score=56.25 TRINITY_DN4436_c0_g1_i1:81-917(+)